MSEILDKLLMLSLTLGQLSHEPFGYASIDLNTAPDIESIETDRILRRGQEWPGEMADLVRDSRFKENNCHYNSAQLCSTDQKKLRICSGYCYGLPESPNADYARIWFRHSWVKDTTTGKLLETTVRRELYFGYVLHPLEARWFDPALGEGKLSAERAKARRDIDAIPPERWNEKLKILDLDDMERYLQKKTRIKS